MFSRQRKSRVLFGLSDVFLTALAFESAYRTRQLLQLERVFYMHAERHALMLGFAVLVWVAIGAWIELYDKLDSGHPRLILSDTFRQCVYGSVCVVLFEYILRLDLSRFFLAFFSAYAFILLLLFRLTAARVVGIIRREFTAPHYVMVVGTGERALSLARVLERSSEYGIRLRGFLDESVQKEGPGARSAETRAASSRIELDSTYPVHPIYKLPLLLEANVIDEVVFAVEKESLAELEEIFLLCDEEGVRTRIAVDFFPHVNSTVTLDRLGPTPLLTFSAAPCDELRLLVKRLTDVVIAGSGLIVLCPMMLAVTILIRITSPGPAIFRQIRCGLNGRRFLFYKFRSMCENAEEMKPLLAHLSTKETAFKIPDDPRLTPVGRWLRKFSIDEWPQLWNVVRGDMSLVGPRPAVPGEVDRYKRWQRRRLRMRPGLTCLWAVSGRDELDFETWMKMDMQYIDNWSLALDWKIMLRTIPRVLTGRGAN